MDIKTLEDRLTGEMSRMRELYRAAFSDSEAERLARETKKQNRTVALLVLLVLVIAVLSSIPETNEREADGLDLVRPSAGDSPKTIETEVSAEYDGYMVRQRAQLRILPKEPTEEEAEECLKGLEQRLPEMILWSNTSLSNVRYDLFLPAIDE